MRWLLYSDEVEQFTIQGARKSQFFYKILEMYFMKRKRKFLMVLDYNHIKHLFFKIGHIVQKLDW